MKIRYMVAALLLVSSALLYSAEKIKLAVAGFESLTAESDSAGMNVSSSAAIENGFMSIDYFEVRKTGAIKEYMDRLTSSQLGIFELDSLKGMSSKLYVKYLTVGSVSKFGDHNELDVRTVNIDNWHIVYSAGASGVGADSPSGYITGSVSKSFNQESIALKEKDPESKPKISVFKFTDSNETAQKAGYGGTFSEILNSELGALANVTAIERVHAKALLNEKQLEMLGIVESDGSDKIFNVNDINYKITGNIKIFKELICMSYSIIDTSTHKPVYLGYAEIASLRGMRPIARFIAKNIEDAVTNKIGTLKLSTVPAGAVVLVDDEPAGVSPLLIPVQKGKHNVKISLAGYGTESKEIEIIPHKISELNLKLEPVSKTLFVNAFQLEAAKDWKNSVIKYREFIDKYKDTADADTAYFRMGYIQYNYIKDYPAALKTFDELISRFPDAMIRAEAYYGLANTYKNMGNDPKAREMAKILVEKFPESFAASEVKQMYPQQ